MRSSAVLASLGSIVIGTVGLVSTALPAEAALTATVRSAVSATSSASGTDYVASFRVSNRTHRAKTAVVVSSVPGLGCTVVVKPRSLGTCKATAHLDKKTARAHSVTVKSGVGSELSFYPAQTTVITKAAKSGTVPTGPGNTHSRYKKGTLRVDKKPGLVELGYEDYSYSVTISNPNDVALPVQVGVTPEGYSGEYFVCGNVWAEGGKVVVPASGSITCTGSDRGLRPEPSYTPGNIRFVSRGNPSTHLVFDAVDSGVKYPTDPADVRFEVSYPYISWDQQLKVGTRTKVDIPLSLDCTGSSAYLTVTSKRLGPNPGRQSDPLPPNDREIALTCAPSYSGPTYTVKFFPTEAEVRAQKISFDLTFTSRGGISKSFTIDLGPGRSASRR